MQKVKSKLEDTYLVQRVREPYKTEGIVSSLGESFSFGGGYKNGGLSNEAMGLLKGIFSFDYMGAAEYEFGALPKSINDMAANIASYSAWTHIINKTSIYVLGQTELKEEINQRLNEIADRKAYIKCGCDLDAAIGKNKYTTKEQCKTIGYFELDNNFAFFTRKNTWENYCKLFGISTPETK